MNKISTNINTYVALKVSCPCAGHEGTCGSGGISPILPNLSGQLHALAASPPKKSTPITHCIEEWMVPQSVSKFLQNRQVSSPCQEPNYIVLKMN